MTSLRSAFETEAPGGHDVIIATPRLALARLTPDDAAAPYLTWMNDPEILRYLEARFEDHDEASLRAYIESCNQDPRVMLLGIFLREEQLHVGNVKLGPVNAHHRTGDLGIIVGERSAWGKGIAREAIQAVCNYAFDRLDLAKVTAGCYHVHEACIRAFRAAGFTVEGRRPGQYSCDGQRVDLVYMGRVR